MSRFFIAFLVALAAITLLTSTFLFSSTVDTEGDAIGYVDAMQVVAGERPPPEFANGARDIFTIHRLLTTSLGIEAVRLMGSLLDSVTVGWFVWDTILFFFISILFYHLIRRLFGSDKTAFLGGLFFAGNYAMVTAGLGQFMDIGGWFFYIASLYFLVVYTETRSERDLLLSALAIAVGGLFKENALVASVPLTAVLLYQNFPSVTRFLKQIVPLAIICAVPVAIHHIYIYLEYGYVYTYWFSLNQELYHYSSRLLEYVKSLGSLLNILGPFALLGVGVWLREWKAQPRLRSVLLCSIAISAIPALMWPGITQRVLFMVVPGAVLFACLFFQKYEKYWYVFTPFLALYILASFTMDSFILDYVNLPF